NKDIKHLERVQKAATELVSSMKKLSYDERLKRLGLTTLQKRRARGDLIEVYRIVTGRERIAKEQFFGQAENNHGLRGHSMKLKKERSRLDIRKFFFSQRVVKLECTATACSGRRVHQPVQKCTGRLLEGHGRYKLYSLIKFIILQVQVQVLARHTPSPVQTLNNLF